MERCGFWYSALLATRTVTRGSRSWVTSHEYRTGLGTFNDYGRPWRTSEDGELDCTTTRTFRSTPLTPYILAPVVKEEVTPNGFEVNLEYDQATGFLLRRTLHQFVPNSPITTYEAWPNGNVKAAIDPMGNRTDFLYAGCVSKVTTPGVVTDYGVSPNGTVAWDETGGLRTHYEYDSGFRLLRVKPPSTPSEVSTWTEYTYDNAHAGFVTVTTAPSVLTLYVDGFGRVRSTVDQAGVQTRVERDACGRTTFESYPYTTGTGPAGVGSTDDALHRPVTVTDGVGTGTPTSTLYAYPVGSVVITDPKNRSTTYEVQRVWRSRRRAPRAGVGRRQQAHAVRLRRVREPDAREWAERDRGRRVAARADVDFTITATCCRATPSRNGAPPPIPWMRLGTSRRSRMPTGRRSCPTTATTDSRSGTPPAPTAIRSCTTTPWGVSTGWRAQP